MPKKGNEKIEIKGDLTVEEALGLIEFIMKQSVRILVPGGSVYCFQGGGGKVPCLPETWLLLNRMKDVYIQNVLVWDKGIGLGWGYRFAWESIIFATVGDEKPLRWHGGVHEQNVIHMRNVIPDVNQHPTQKPIPLLEKIVGNSSDRGDIVIDPTAGALTTGKAAKALGRRYCMMELEQRWVKQNLAELAAVREKTSLIQFFDSQIPGRRHVEAAHERLLLDFGNPEESDPGTGQESLPESGA